MNQLYFEGRVINLYSEDYQFLQDSVNAKVTQAIKYFIANQNESCIMGGFVLKVNETYNDKFDILHETSTGQGGLLTAEYLVYETSDEFVEQDLKTYDNGTILGVYAKVEYTLASYDRQNDEIVYEPKAIDLYNYTLVHNRKVLTLEIEQYTDLEFSALPVFEQKKYVLLGKITANGESLPISAPDYTDVKYLTIMMDEAVNADKVDNCDVETTLTTTADDKIPTSKAVADYYTSFIVDTPQIQDLAVTTDKLADESVTNDKIATDLDVDKVDGCDAATTLVPTSNVQLPTSKAVADYTLSKLDTDITVTVGSTGDYTTINDAIESLTKMYPLYKSTGVRATINLLAGFIMSEQVFVDGLDLSWITIEGVDAETTISRSSLMNILIDRYPAFGAIHGGKLPIINQLFSMNTSGVGSERDGIYCNFASSAIILSNGGIKNAGGMAIRAVNSSLVEATQTIFTGSSSGLYALRNSSINASFAEVYPGSGAGTVGSYVKVESGSTINVVDATLENGTDIGQIFPIDKNTLSVDGIIYQEVI